ncbi:PEGA domain-containing protein [Thermococcus sp. 18S1]|uniref:DUF5711 family protein n=1 Tax=Thermococcus sp. 18S1 TaxID=1638210 RepID=UPI001439C638|nr:DUF5711 family protein [Thermococcus sp. 18S1]NJE29444.1 PEGA domain-containing protein [Thermococcus sp. 18S1]
MKNRVSYFTEGHLRKLMTLLFVSVLVLTVNPDFVRGNTMNPTWTYVTDRAVREIGMPEDGSFVIVGTSTSEDGMLYKFNSNGNMEWNYHLPSRLDSMSISPDGNYIVAGTKGGLHILDEEGNLIRKVIPPSIAGSPENTFHAVTISPLGNYVATECNGVIILYDTNGSLLWAYSDIVGYVSSEGIGFSKDEKYLAVGFYDLGVYLFNIHGELLWKFTKLPQNIRVVTFVSDNYIAVGTSTSDYSSGSVYLFDINGNIIWKYTTDGGVSSISTSQDGNYIVASTGKSGVGMIYLFTKEGKLIWAYNTGNPVNRVLVSNNGSYIISVGGSGVYRFNRQGDVLSSYRTGSALFKIAASRDLNVAVFGGLYKLYFVNFSNESAPAVLKIETSPSGSEVYLNGKYLGTAPLNISLQPGTYTLKITKNGYSDYVSSITLASGETKIISATLNRNTGYLSVNSSPSGAKVYLDGRYIGTTPLESYMLPPGEYTLKIVADNHETYSRNVSIEEGKKVTIRANLTPLQPAILQSKTSAIQITTATHSTTNITSPIKETSTPVTPTATTPSYTMYVFGLLALFVVGALTIAKSKGKPVVPMTSSTSTKSPLNSTSIAKEETNSQRAPRPDSYTLQKIPHFPQELLNKYEPLELLGEGGFARVYKVKRRNDGKIVALKIPRMDEKTSKNFIKEVSAWLHLNHPNIVRLHDTDILPVPYLEMEFVEGVEVGGKLVRDLGVYPKPMDEKTARELIKGIARGLAHAHSKGIYHRDLKPQNVLLKADLTPKITDWGLSKLETSSSSISVIGYTPLYAAPEHLMPSKYGHTDHRTDIWQLGVTFYELLTGKLPFEGYTHEEIFGKIIDEEYRFTPPSRIDPKLAKYDEIFEKLLAKRKEKRYGSIAEFLADLRRLDEIEAKKENLEREILELKKTLVKSVEDLKKSRNVEETVKHKQLVVETLGKLAIAYAELNKKAELLNTLSDLKFYTIHNLSDLMNAIESVEMMVRENLPVGDEFIERLKVLVHRIRRENEAGGTGNRRV